MDTAGSVVYVVKRWPELTQTFVVEEVAELRRRGWHVEVAHLGPPIEPAPSAPDVPAMAVGGGRQGALRLLATALRVGLHRPLGLAAAASTALRWGSRRDLRSLAAALRLVAHLDGRRPGRLHAHFADEPAEVALLASLLLGVPFSFTGHAVDLFVQARHLPDVVARADVTVMVCDYNRRWLRERFPDARVAVAVCGVDPGRWRRSSPLPPPGEPLRVACVGRLVEKKGIADLVDATAILRDEGMDVVVEVLGAGPLQDELAARVAAHGLEDRLLLRGAVPPDEVRATLEASALFCLPCVVASDGDRDAMPVSVKEAMALELVVVSTDEVAVPEMVDHGVSGLLAAPGDPASLASALRRAAGMTAHERAAMGSAARARVAADFTLASQVDDLLAAWSGVHAATPTGVRHG